MSRRIHLWLLAAAAGLIAVIIGVVLLRTGDPHPVPSRMAGDLDEVVRDLAPSELPTRARGFLATDRPWRAARTMSRYFGEEPAASDDLRVLAARAEAGWENWSAVLELLEPVETPESYADGLPLWLLGRALESTGRDTSAIDAYRAFLAFAPAAGPLATDRAAARLRLGLALLRTGDRSGGEEILGSLDDSGMDWLDILRADALAGAGDTAAVRGLTRGFDEGVLGLRGRRARVEAARRAGDLAGARALANAARGWASTDDTRTEFLLLAGRMALAMGDTTAARDAFRTVIDRDPGGAHSREAATLLREDELSPADHIVVARVQVAQGLHEEALEHFEAWLEADATAANGADRADVRLEYATALFYSDRFRQAVRALEPIRDRTPARRLEARAEAYRGRSDRAAEIYQELAREDAGSGAGAYTLFLAAGTLHEAGEADRARPLYRQVVDRYPSSRWTELALMRLAGMAFVGGDYERAADLWDDYLERRPRGDFALQSTYWAARARAEAGDRTRAEALYREVIQSDRDSYYALKASERLGEEFWPLPMSESPGADAEAASRVREWMRQLDLLRGAGFDEAASGLADQLTDRVGGDRATRYALAEALAQRGYSQSAIRLGITLQGSGPPSRRLLQILYPFPYRMLISEEARDRGLDPFIAAALIRQESMFERRITSLAGARGLMQIMPATGRDLARAVDMERWDAELLYHPEINVHLGTRYVAQLLNDYDGSLPAVFSAYNAGPHRVDRWSRFPEFGREELFTERIPFQETRNYVKILTRNRAIYQGLYSGE